jgi:phospholipid/cholesterol/gamma-HCH transport system permease protein
MALRLIILISLLIGGIIIIQTINQLPKVGGEDLIGTILVLVIVREVGPMLVAFIIIGRSATAITTEIASMRVSGQFTMLLTTGVDPNIYLFAPRIWGMIMSMLALIIFFNAFAIIGGFLMARAVTYIDFYFLIKGFFKSLTMLDMVILNLKAFFMAVTISIISIREGIKVGIASTEIPQATTRTVVRTIFYTLLIDIFFAGIFYL